MKNNLLSLVCLVFIFGYAFASQYFYSIYNPHYVVDFGHYFLYENGFYPEFKGDPSGYVRQRFLAFFVPRENEWAGELSWKKTPFHMWVLSIFFYVFGKTLFVHKMSMLWAVWGLALAAFFMITRYTRSAIAGLSGTMLLLATPNIAVFSRTTYSFIPMACFVSWGLIAYRRYREQAGWLAIAAFHVSFVVACWTHYSAFLYFLIPGACLFIEKRHRAAALSFMALYVLCGWAYLRGDMTIGFFNHFRRLDISTGWGDIPGAAAVIGRSMFNRPLAGLFGGMWDQLGGFFFIGLAVVLARYRWRTAIPPDTDEGEKSMARFMAVFMGSLFACAALFGIVQIENYSPFYAMGVVILSIALWRGSFSRPWIRRGSQACLVVIALGTMCRIPAIDESWLDRRMTADLSQLFHYMRTSRGAGPIRVATVFAGKVPANDEAMKFRRTLIEVPAFYGGMDLDERTTWCQIGTVPMPPEVSERVREADYVFVFLRRREDSGPGISEEKKRVLDFLKKRGLFQSPGDPVRHLVSYNVGNNNWLIVLRRTGDGPGQV